MIHIFMANEGLAYEQQLFMQYQSMGLVPNGFNPAGSNPHAPDLVIMEPSGRPAIIEIKVEGIVKELEFLDYGQAGIIQNPKTMEWIWSPRASSHPAAIYLRNELQKEGIIQKINTHWRGLVSAVLTEGNSRKNRQVDRDRFPKSTNGEFRVRNTLAKDYYASKGVNYIQVKNKGFYLIGQDVLNLNPPRFIPNAITCICRRKGSRFTTALRVEGYPSSRIDMDDYTKFRDLLIQANTRTTQTVQRNQNSR